MAVPETPLPEALDESALARALSKCWRLPAVSLRYVPKGLGGYNWTADAASGERWFVKVDDLHEKPWLGDDADTVFGRLVACYRCPLELFESGLEFVVPPLEGGDGEVVLRLAPALAVSVLPFVDGDPGT